MNLPGGLRLVAPPVEALPYPSVPRVHLRAIEDALIASWQRFLGNPTLDLSALAMAHEDAITAPLVEEMERMRCDGGGALRCEIFAAVMKSDELFDYAGSSLWKKPDIIVRFQSPPREVLEPRYYAVFIETKIVDGGSGKPAKLYCTQGVQRFISGDYAWKMREGMLCAYVLDGSRLSPMLPRVLAVNHLTPLDALTPRPWPEPSNAEAAHTRHMRSWAYVAPNTGSPGPITLSHLWLRVG